MTTLVHASETARETSARRGSAAPQRAASSRAARRSGPTLSGTAGSSARTVGGMDCTSMNGLPARTPAGNTSTWTDRIPLVRRALSCWLLVLAAAAPAAHGATCAQVPAGWQPHVDQARDWAAQRHGTVSFAVRTDTRLAGWRARRTVNTASVLKAMLLVAYLNRGSVRDRALTDADLKLLAPMIRRSDNAAATRVLAIVGDAGLYRVAHAAGMRHFHAAAGPIWGASRTDAADQTRFFLHLERYVAPRHRATAFHLLRTITRSQRWGIGRVRLPGWKVYFKGGWGSATGATDHQIALLRGCGDTRLAVAVMTKFQGSHDYGKRTLEGVFRRLLRGLAQ